MRSELLIPVLVLTLLSGVAAVEIGTGQEIRQHENNVDINFSQQLNFSSLDIFPTATEFEGSNFTVEPENDAGLVMDFYDHQAGLQDYVANYSASSTGEVNFSISDLPGGLFYEAFFSSNGTRIFIGYTDSNDTFNFSKHINSADISVFHYGEKGVAVENVTFNDSDPVEGDKLNVMTNVSNEGVVDPEQPNVSVKVDTYNGTEWVQEDFLTGNETVPINDSVKANLTWTIKPGPWRFDVTLDPKDEIKETDETNNQESSLYNVPSYNIFYGGSDTELNLGAGSSDIYIWNPTTDKGNLFFADIDSSYSFPDLEPVESGSFSTIDQKLNMTGHNDSIQEEWDANSDGVADQNKTYNVGQRSLEVPVTNSTTDGTWKTGILYDSSDGSTYDGSQDLIFITEINDSAAGKYGTYDYEAKIPSSLRDLKKGSSEVEIYTEVH